MKIPTEPQNYASCFNKSLSTGEKGLIFWNEESKTIKLVTDIWKDKRMNYEPKIERFNVDSNPLRNELEEFVQCVETKKEPISNINNAVEVAKNLDLLFKTFRKDI